jgi:hypothetical protein
VRELVSDLQRQVACVTHGVLIPQGYHPAPQPQVISFGNEQGTSLLTGAYNLQLLLRHFFSLTRSADSRLWVAETSGYIYEIVDQRGDMLISFHWHPMIETPYPFAHIHVTDTTGPVNLAKKHIPSGPVALAAVLRFAIIELGVAPLRDDWQTILDTHAA